MAIAGYNKAVSIKTTGSSVYLNVPGTKIGFNIGATLLDITDYTSTGWTARIAGLKDYSISGDAIYDTTITAVNTLFSAFLAGTTLDFKYLPNGTRGFHGQALVQNFNMSGDVNGVETFSFTLQSKSAGGLTTV
jgi:predicted secreted protein